MSANWARLPSRDFVAAGKKDFILFQLEVALKDAAGDTGRMAGVVNQVAETISKISKAEDFTKRQSYVRQSAEILRITEEGLNDLVNKFTRERIGKQESRAAGQGKAGAGGQGGGGFAGADGGGMGLVGPDGEIGVAGGGVAVGGGAGGGVAGGACRKGAVPSDDDTISLLFRHEQNERGMIRSLLDYGLRAWDENISVADYILAECLELYELIDNKRC